MGPAAVLRVLVMVDGMTKTAAQVKGLDSDLQKAGRSADTARAHFATAGREARTMGDHVAKATQRVKAFGNGVGQAHPHLRQFVRGLAAVGGGAGSLVGGIARLAGGFGRLGGFVVAALAPLLALSGALFAVGAALGPLVGLGAAAAVGLTAAAQAFGVFKLATMGVGDALKEQLTAHKAAAGAATTGASQQRAAAKAIASAQESVRAAKLAVGDASRRVQDALRNEKLAGEGLTEAHQRAKTAQEALTMARRAAHRQLEDMRSALAGTALDERQAAIDVNLAYEQLNKVNADATAGVLDRAQAVLDVEKAEQRLSTVRDERVRGQKELTKAERDGVKGSEQVVAAEKQVEDAHKGVTDAKRQARDAARGTADAERGLAEAQRQVRMALKDVTAAQTAAAASAATAATASADLNEKFNALPPAAQAFVRVLQSLQPKLDQLRAVAAAGLFPGVTAGLQAAMGSFESVKKVTGETATVMGGLAKRAGELVGSKGFGKDLETIGGRNALVIDRLGRAAIYLGDGFRHLLVAAGPLTTWLAKVTMEWARGAAQALKAGRESGKLGEFFHSTRKTLIRVVSIIGNLTTAFFEMGKVAAPSGRGILKALDEITARFAGWTKSIGGQRALQNFFTESTKLAGRLMPALGGVLGSLGELAFYVMPAYITILETLGPLAGPLVQMFILYKVALTAVAVATNLVAAAQWLWNAAMTANPIALVIVGLVALAAAIVVAYKKSETFREIVDAAWVTVKKVAAWLVATGGPAFTWLATAVRNAWNAIKTVTESVWGWMKTHLGGVWGALKVALSIYFTAYKTIVTTAWNAIKTVTETVWAAIKLVASTAWSAIKTSATITWELIKLAILGPIRAGRDTLAVIWDAIKTVAGEAWGGIKKVIKAAADPILDVILAPFKGAVKGVAKFAKLILEVVGKIPGVDTKGPVAAIDKFVGGLAKGGTFQAFARGGAFARTGGLVASPITLMGEEAPRHPEFVIPTNPAYRGRAQGLLGQAASAIGLAQGGQFGSNGTGNGPYMSQQQITDLYTRLKMPNPRLMAAIAMAESSGEIDAFGPPSGMGLLQIEWNVWADKMRSLGLTNPNDPTQNTAMAKVILASQGLSAWVAYTTGRHLPFYKDMSLGAKAGDIAGMLDPRKLVGQLPGVGDLPDWLGGLGNHVLGKVKDYITGALSFDAVGGMAGPGAGSLVNRAINLAQSLGHPHPTPGQIDQGNHAEGSLHYQGRAVDFGDAGQTVEKMQRLFMAIYDMFGSKINELFYDRMPWYIDAHQKIAGQFGGHGDHIHAGFARGGTYGGLPYVGKFHNGGVAPREGLAHVSAGERMTPAGEGGVDVHLHFADGMGWLKQFVRVEITERDRQAAGAYRAGVA